MFIFQRCQFTKGNRRWSRTKEAEHLWSKLMWIFLPLRFSQTGSNIWQDTARNKRKWLFQVGVGGYWVTAWWKLQETLCECKQRPKKKKTLSNHDHSKLKVKHSNVQLPHCFFALLRLPWCKQVDLKSEFVTLLVTVMYFIANMSVTSDQLWICGWMFEETFHTDRRFYGEVWSKEKSQFSVFKLFFSSFQ